MPTTSKKFGEHIALGLSVLPSVRYAFEISHIFGTMYARILKFHICIAYETIADLYGFIFNQTHQGGVRPLYRKAKYLRNHLI